MEKKINIAELLKDCPSGMELDCTSYDNVSFDKISDDKKATYPIFCYITDKEGNRSGISFTENGCESKRYGAKCVIFPKGKTTWEGFVPPCQFKDGDIVATSSGLWIGITTGGKCGRFMPTYCVITNYGAFEAYLDRKESWQFHRLATEEEKEKLFDAIKDNGYRWNFQAKRLEKLIVPNFRKGDKVRVKKGISEPHIIEDICDTFYTLVPIGKIYFTDQDNWELVPNKFDISILKPFESKVLVRTNNGKWVTAFYSHYDNDSHLHYCVVGGLWYAQCIPYENNKHLLGTTNDCDEYFKTWE